MNREQYIEFLEDNDFNPKQIKLILDVRANFEDFEEENENNYDWSVLVDGWERAQWSVFNKSELFEVNEENTSDITDWAQFDTRYYITEMDVKSVRIARYPL